MTSARDALEAASLVVEGDVASVRTSFVVDEGEEFPVTLYDVRVGRTLRGEPLPSFTLAVLGGPARDGRAVLSLAGAPLLEEGDHALFSVRPYLDVGYLPVGLGLGVVRRDLQDGIEVAALSESRTQPLVRWGCDPEPAPRRTQEADDGPAPPAPGLPWSRFLEQAAACLDADGGAP